MAAALLVGVLTGCEGAIEHNITNLTAPDPPVVDSGLKTLARDRSQDQCDASEVTPAPDPEALYGPGAVELVARAVLDPDLDDPSANHEATRLVWQSWRDDPTLHTGQWERMGAGEATCADGYLYMTLVLQGTADPDPDPDPDPDDPWAPGVVRVTSGNAVTHFGGISTDGSLVALSSPATDLLPGGNVADVFLYDTSTGDLTATGLEPVSEYSLYSLALAGDGEHLVYGDLVDYEGGWPADSEDLFLWNIGSGATTRLTASFNPHIGPSISDDASTVTSTHHGAGDASLHIHDVSGGSSEWHSGIVGLPQISLSADGRYVAGSSFGFTEVLDRVAGSTATVATDCFPIMATTGGGSALSGDGRYFAYTCWDQPTHPEDDDGQVDLFVWDRTTGSSELVTAGDDGLGMMSTASISDDGRFVAYAYERPASSTGAGIYLLDRTTGESTLVAPVAPAAVAVSGDGSTVAFTARAPDQTNPSIPDLFVWTNPTA